MRYSTIAEKASEAIMFLVFVGVVIAVVADWIIPDDPPPSQPVVCIEIIRQPMPGE